MENKILDLSTVVNQTQIKSYTCPCTPAVNAITEAELDHHRSAAQMCAITTLKYRYYF